MADTAKEIVERLRAQERKSRDVVANCAAVTEALSEQLEHFERRDPDRPWNTYAVRVAVDHQSSARTEAKLADTIAEAATLIEQLVAERDEALLEIDRVAGQASHAQNALPLGVLAEREACAAVATGTVTQADTEAVASRCHNIAAAIRARSTHA